jgi:hypothetical protein
VYGSSGLQPSPPITVLGLKKKKFKLDSKKAVPPGHHHMIKGHGKNLKSEDRIFIEMNAHGAR